MLIRDATADDYDDYARLLPELGVGDPVPSRERFATELVGRMVVAVDDDRVVGYGLVEVMADVGYVRNIVADPRRRRGGVGAALMEAMRQRSLAAGAQRWCLNVKPDNAPAVALYQRCGLSPAYRAWTLRIAGDVALPPPGDLAFSTVTPGEDPAVEDAFTLLRGQLASARTRPGRQLVQVHQAGALVGVAIFSASIPGAFPFRLRDPALGPRVVAHLRTLAPPAAAYVQVAVEEDEALSQRLMAIGATLRHDILHMRGPI